MYTKGEKETEKFQAIDASQQQILDQTKRRLGNRFKPTTTGTRRVSKDIQMSTVPNTVRIKKMIIIPYGKPKNFNSIRGM